MLHDVCDNAACMRLARGRFFFIYEFINSIRLHASILTGGVLLYDTGFSFGVTHRYSLGEGSQFLSMSRGGGGKVPTPRTLQRLAFDAYHGNPLLILLLLFGHIKRASFYILK